MHRSARPRAVHSPRINHWCDPHLLFLGKAHAKAGEFSACEIAAFREVGVVAGRARDGNAVEGFVGRRGIDRGEVVGEQSVDAGDPPRGRGGVVGGLSLEPGSDGDLWRGAVQWCGRGAGEGDVAGCERVLQIGEQCGGRYP